MWEELKTLTDEEYSRFGDAGIALFDYYVASGIIGGLFDEHDYGTASCDGCSGEAEEFGDRF